ncbi:rfaE bifunctional protein [Desulfonatronospira thiodismutans ASO3-1]|uniref:D-glycero-beta-D-manno-heptose 1-phosphate adenylyltransferase n=1 Tax=Desulfonatronospira thiodismutans ASO3-1 TaxID=555779 RepID=D6STA1_9BACT|nr:D-glycero-beta-D-manno-heptose 1-phosphate adenylyltransferase [Desulfonatronospira thiodismutans]EFI33917.1 rfaE bifunctional protein [Desulfonatronospira thiodismutans ASO3-1]RQD72975.1 MAG: D-glycero-beta-D-manno-heptose 1-phosphate adenylyltransferase [Desulfonatronospira sp. MSAO_Bac3]
MNSTNKIITAPDFAEKRHSLLRQKIVFTNGCFDLLHAGHVDYLEKARSLGDLLVVGVNSDSSVKRIKPGLDRPVNTETDRARVLAGLGCVDQVIIFGEDTPYSLIEKVRPNILVKGGDWPVEKIVGRDIVQGLGGEVLSIPFIRDCSTTGILERIKRGF